MALSQGLSMATKSITQREISNLLNNIRRSIEAHLAVFSANEEDRRVLMGVSFQVEGIRSRSRNVAGPDLRSRPNLLPKFVKEMTSGIETITENYFFMNVAKGIPLQYHMIRIDEEEESGLLSGLVISQASVADALFELLNSIRMLDIQANLFDGPNTTSDIVGLARSVPIQKVGPIQLEIRHGRLSILPQASEINQNDFANTSAARSEIVRRGEALLKDLANSNADPRLIREVENLNYAIINDQNIIQVGLSSLGCSAMCAGLKEEMSNTLNAMLNSYTLSIDMYASQFPDWSRFVEQAALTQIEQDDIIEIKNTLGPLVQKLADNLSVVDPEVPETFARLGRLLQDPRSSSKRAAFAVVRSIENLVSKILSYAGNLIEQTVSKAIDKASTVIAGAAVAGLLTIALSGATGVGPVASKIHEFQWLKNAIEVVEAHLQKMKRAE